MSPTDPVASGDSLADRLARCYTGVVYDTLRGRGITACVLPPSIVPLDPAMVAAGPVFTVQGEDDERALMGELSAETLQFRGVRGFIVDGGCRDTAFIRRLGFPVFADKATPRDIVGAWLPVAYDEPISYGQVVVRPGDYVLADCDGIVVVPQAIAAEVVDAATTSMQTEDKVRAAILSGVDPRQAYLDHGKF
jgi:4-hydroxy-4-methyl-2-oxoglutarate aldolase